MLAITVTFIGQSFYQHPSIPHCVLFAAGRNYPPDLTCCPTTGKICPFHHDLGYLQVALKNNLIRYCSKPEIKLSKLDI